MRAQGTHRILMVLRRCLHSEQQEEGKEQGVERRRRHERKPQRSHCYWQPEAPEVAEAPLKKMHALLRALYAASVSRCWWGTCTNDQIECTCSLLVCIIGLHPRAPIPPAAKRRHRGLQHRVQHRVVLQRCNATRRHVI